MSVIGRIVGLAVVGMAGAMAVGAAGAMSAKQRIVPTTDPADDEITLASIFGPLAYRSTATQFPRAAPSSAGTAAVRSICATRRSPPRARR